MGFDGSGRPVKTMSGQEILARLRRTHDLTEVPRGVAAVAQEYEVDGHAAAATTLPSMARIGG
ncbi:hypothetical protein CO151_01820 [bacterium CG_4_9_14_3_um_filter_65_15]|nr:MAG: hypothetical protein CO151_01820 [bacterium CG_4_9_14_3_um_filter_65_15]